MTDGVVVVAKMRLDVNWHRSIAGGGEQPNIAASVQSKPIELRTRKTIFKILNATYLVVGHLFRLPKVEDSFFSINLSSRCGSRTITMLTHDS